MRSGTTATESGNTYEQLVRTWRLADLIAHTLTTPTSPRSITFQHRALLPWDDIVETTPSGLHAYQVKNLETAPSRAQLSDLLQALHRTPTLHRATLVLGHALTPKPALDVMLVKGLAFASRIASGRLPRFAREGKETEALARVAELLGGTTPDEAFALLQRFDVTILHGHEDVRELTIRTLHPFFEHPQHLARALLAFVVETGARGIEIHYDTLEQHVLPELPRRTTPWQPVPPGLPDDEILLWRRDRRGKARTLWLSTKAPGLVVADLPGLYLGSSSALWRWTPSETQIPFAVGEDLTPPIMDDHAEIELRPVESARLENVMTGATIELGAIPEGFEWVIELQHTVDPLGTFGHILLAAAHARGMYGGDATLRDPSFTALDLESGQPFELWTPDEAQAYVARYADRAAQELDRKLQCGRLDASEGAAPPTLTTCAPYYDDAYELRARLQITFDVAGADTDGSWVEYCASATVEADTLPALLRPVATAPAVLRAYWGDHPIDERCGWSRVPTAGPARARLAALAREASLPRLAASLSPARGLAAPRSRPRCPRGATIRGAGANTVGAGGRPSASRGQALREPGAGLPRAGGEGGRSRLERLWSGIRRSRARELPARARESSQRKT